MNNMYMNTKCEMSRVNCLRAATDVFRPLWSHQVY